MTDGGFVLPSGTVTLLLGDVEGSTRAWEADPQATAVAVNNLNELVEEMVGRFDGVRPVEQGEGDSFVAAFSRSRDGVACALSLQKALAGGPLRVRLGLHTGDVVRRDQGNYVGPTIIRAARLRNLAHGGQTVVSEATRELVVDALPEQTGLRDLGVHRLKDLSRPERVFQLCHPQLPTEFPPLRSLDVHPHNLPVQRTTFIGRSAEIAELTDLVAGEPLVTLTGSGGCGKTRLGLQVAAEMLDRFPDGVWFIDLAAVADDAGVAAKAAQALGVVAGPGVSSTDAIVAHLGSARVLLVMDNCEHVSEAAAVLVDAVLSGCSLLRVVATSRQLLGVPGEVVRRVPCLSLPTDAGPSGIEGLSRSEAIELFVERAGRARPGFRVDEHNREGVHQICRRLDGIPLAIELAAARVRVLTPTQIARGLDERFRLLTGLSRTAVPRQQTLEASLDWSHALLTELEREVFRRLAIFPATFDLDAAAVVCAADGIEPWQVLDLLMLLVDKNLVTVDDSGETARYRLLETIRVYGRDRLMAAKEDDRARTCHRDHYLSVAEQAAPRLEGSDAADWAVALTLDWPNFESALVCCRDRDEPRELCRLVVALSSLWAAAGVNWRIPSSVGCAWIDSALAAAEPNELATRAQLLWSRSAVAYNAYDFGTLAACGEEGLAIARSLDDRRLAGRCLTALAWARAHTSEAGRFWEEAVASSRAAGDTYMLLTELTAGMSTFHLQRNPAATRAALREADEILATGSWPASFRANASIVAGWLALLEGRLADASELFQHAREVDSTSTTGVVAAEGFYAVVNALSGDFVQALAAADRHSELATRLGAQRIVLELQARALIACAQGDQDSASSYAARALRSAAIAPWRAAALNVATQIELAAGHQGAAKAHVDELADLARAEGFLFSAVDARLLNARLLRQQDELDEAEGLAHSLLTQAAEIQAWIQVTETLELLAGLAGHREAYEQAARLLGAARSLRESTGYRLCLTSRDSDLDAAHHALGERFEEIWSEGRALTINNTIAYAQRGRGQRGRPSSGWSSLTPAERQIVELVRHGCTNSQIGDRLFVSPRTVQSHLTRIYAKLDVAGRTQLAIEAAHHQAG